jgi:4-amino-4-deoxy-L-arabinose transferase
MELYPAVIHAFFYLGIVGLFASLILFSKKRLPASLLLLFGAALSLRLWAIHFDPFLHTWDEAFHAIVSKNFMLNPLVPRLRQEALLPYDPIYWCCNYYWLHKPPLFMWQMALSMKVFGVGLFGLRFPSALMGAIQCLLLYRLGKNTLHEETGFWAAFLFAFSSYNLEMVGGAASLDHNDTAMLFYITASFWALSEYHVSRQKRWVLLIGLFAGMAILVKWMIGLLVFAGWGLGLAYRWLHEKKSPWRAMLALLAALLVALACFLPWDLYTAHRFPVEHAYEKNYNLRHVFEPLENQTSGYDFYFKNLKEFFFPYAWLAILLGFFFLWKNARDKWLPLVFIASTLGAWAFFSFVAQTKMSGFTNITTSFFMLAFGALAAQVLDVLKKRANAQLKLATLVFGISAAWLMLNPVEIYRSYHDPVKSEYGRKLRGAKISNTLLYQQLDTLWPGDGVVLFLPNYEYLDLMFFSKKQAYGWPKDEEVELLLSKGLSVGVFQNAKPPQWFADHPEVHPIPRDLQLDPLY